MFQSTLTMRVLALTSLAALPGCALLQPQAPPPDAAFVVLGENGRAAVRVITTAASCPAITIDGQRHEMGVRVPMQAIPARPGAAAQPASDAVLTCEAAIPAGAAQVQVAGRALPLPVGAPRRLVVIGDTGCRIKGKSVQDCNDQEAFPFARIAAAAAAWKPDLVVHLGDYHYREDPCPAGRAGCAGSPWGYGWDAWKADFFAPAGALLHAAPWVMARGNHESCARAGQGYWRYLDPRAFVPGRDCDLPAGDRAGDYSDPYAVPLGDSAQLIVFDSANTTYKGLPPGDPRRAIYGGMWRQIAHLSTNARHNIAIGHHPLFAFGANRNAKTGEVTLYGGDKGLLDAFGDHDPAFLPKQISMLLSGHVHLWEQVSFSSGHPTQFVSGFSGTAADLVPLPATIPAGVTPAPGALVEHMSSWIGGFGFMTMERTGADTWRVTVRDRDGRERNSCEVSGRRSHCRVAQVP